MGWGWGCGGGGGGGVFFLQAEDGIRDYDVTGVQTCALPILLLPFSNQVRRLRPGDRALVRICLDQTSGRLVATAKLGKFLADTAPATVSAGDRVSLQIAEQTDLGVKAIVDDLYWGLLPDGSTGRVPAIGERCTGYISRLRDDGLVDLDRKSTRLNSSHVVISYAVFCLKKNT